MVQVGRKPLPVDLTSFAGRVGSNVRRIRTSKGCSVDDAASDAGFDRSTWYRIEQGIRPGLTGRSIDAIATMWGLDLGDLLRKPRAT
jgi:transcriptional regulator with XRE-family HTH domain